MLTEAGVRRLVKRVSAELGEDSAPPVSFTDKNGAHYHEKSGTIILPSARWVKRHKACSSMGYRLLVLHEMAHHLFGVGHTANFYSGLFGLCALYGVPISFAYADEHSYKPRAASRGLDKYLHSLENRIDETT